MTSVDDGLTHHETTKLNILTKEQKNAAVIP